MDRMTIRSDPAWKAKAPGGFPCTIILRANDGREERVDVAFAKGHARNKMTRDEIIAKFQSCVAGILSPMRTDEIIAAVYSLETLPSVRDLAKLLGAQQH
jgi:2-methylcitrate dehydratase PrpD